MSVLAARRAVDETIHTWRALLRIPNVRWLALARLLSTLYFYSAVIVRFEMGRGLNFTQIFLLESVLSFSILVLNIPTGVLADRFGYRPMLVLSHALDASSVVVMLVAHGFLFFAASSVLFGAGVACASGCEESLLLRSLPTSEAAEGSGGSGAAFALLGACSSVGFLLGLSAGSLFAAHDPSLAVAATLAPSLLAVGAALLLRSEGSAHATDGSPVSGQAVLAASLLRRAARVVVSQPTLVGLSLLESISFSCVNAIFWYNQPLLARARVLTQWFGPLTAVAVACGVLLALALPFARRALRRRWLVAVSLAAPGVGYLLLAQAHHASVVVALLALVAGGSVWRTPLVNEAINERIAPAGRATVLSVLSFLGALVGIGANALVGRAGDRGLPVVGLALGVGLLLMAVASLWLMSHHEHSRDHVA